MSYLDSEKVMNAFAVIILLMAGWLFSVIVGIQTTHRDRMDAISQRLAVLEGSQNVDDTEIMEIRRRIRDLETNKANQWN